MAARGIMGPHMSEEHDKKLMMILGTLANKAAARPIDAYVGIGVNNHGPYLIEQSFWYDMGDEIECAFQVHIDKSTNTYCAMLVR